GTIQNLEAIGKICKERGVLFHTDACQSFTKVPIDIKKQNLDLVTLNAHKIHGPKGVGALYIRSGIKIVPLAHGGGHEKKLRSGTENIPGIVGFAKAVDIASDKDVKKMEKLRDMIIDGLLKIDNVKLNGPRGDNHVLKAIGLPPLQSNSSLRISISKYTTEEDVKYFLEKIQKIVKKLRAISPLIR
ncbi:MAG: aminotransferase class V-fold PLP-dependent enzyme, partial [Candidatus Pacearchaeota archaeon]|nr:aminotransferase class V-fold PLP-dependent enzyme [Candidatus Pacearchaeota archaeon]